MKIINFSKIIAAYDLKVGSYTELNDLVKLHEYQRSRSSHSIFKLKFCFFSKTVGLLETKYHVKASGNSERKIIQLGLLT